MIIKFQTLKQILIILLQKFYKHIENSLWKFKKNLKIVVNINRILFTNI